ncbi:nitrous oxide reductase family maturation protein NosD [uncultured Ferrovibrio sp.]|jgi:nitrous oxidase accessory protein|uniref:nitrous oxide reductase family maturation protein NosD n=1 Tax=uncultured Ferrovibrio sp. TaxID=1576913 RepID=UPI00261CF0FD|nr:nitrous oxide reductase family maturation protein NosD [uncultured Ferrovibrio sp.]
MRARKIAFWMGPAALLAAGLVPPAQAERVVIQPGADLQAALERSVEGDVLSLAPGIYRGNLRISRQVTLEGTEGAVIEGDGQGNAITVTAAGAVVRGLSVRGSGMDLDAMHAGIFLEKTATGAVVENNRLEGNLYGVYVHGAEKALVRGNVIRGITQGRINEAGNGVSLWNAPGAKVVDNDISFGRDGIYTISSRNNLFSGNRFSDLRFAVHYMYTNDSEISGNVSTGNSVGFAIMYSNRLVVKDNVSDGDRDHGFLFNYANGSRITGNAVYGKPQPAERWIGAGNRSVGHGVPASEDDARPVSATRIGPEKCVFIYNANQNRFHNNRFEGCEIGIHFTAGSEGNEMTGNAFIRNRNQVKYVGTRHLDWSKGGRGNYWSDNPAFDLNGDGISDTAYRPNDLVDKVLWTAPQAKLLVNSPAVQVIRWAQSQFPALVPGGVIDSAPLMTPPAIGADRTKQ